MPGLVFKLLRLDQAGLQQPRDEGAGAGEGVHDVDALAAERLAELASEQLVHRAENEVHDLHGRVNDAEPVR